MKTLLWKELRQIALVSLLMLIALSAAVVVALYTTFESGYRDVSILDDEVLLTLIFGAGAAALALGFLQTVLEVRRDQWAFLLHRGVSATTVFLAKTMAGLLAYAVITLFPVAIAVVWCCRGGIERYPFSMYQTLPMLVTILASAALYFAGMLLIVWKGPWYFSRILPLAAPCLAISGVVFFALGITNYVPVSVFLLTALSVGILAVAAWGAFVRSGESPGRSWGATVCLGVPLFVALFAAMWGVAAFAVTVYHEFHYRLERDSWYTRPVSWRTVNHLGHVCEFVAGPATSPTKNQRLILSAIDLDDSESRQYAALAGQTFEGPSGLKALPAWDPLPMTHVWWSDYGPQAGTCRRRVLTQMETTEFGARLRWYYSSADGWLYAYHEEFEEVQGRQRRKPPRLAHIVGPDGFTNASRCPAQKFGILLGDATSYWCRANQWPTVGGPASGSNPGNSGRFFLLCEDGLYDIDIAGQSVRHLFAIPEGKKIRSLAPVNDQIAVVYDDSISLYSAIEIPTGLLRIKGEDPRQVPATLGVPDKLQCSFPIPKEVAPFHNFGFGRLPDEDVIVFQTGFDWPMSNFDRFVHMRLDGTVLRSRDFIDPERIPSENALIMDGFAVFAPAGPLVLASALDSANQTAAGTGPGVLVRLWQAAPREMLLLLALLTTVAVGCGWSVNRTARKYGFDDCTQRIWLWVAILFGPAGLVTLWFLRDWPALETCPACTMRRPVNCDACPQCGEKFAPPPANATEIIVADTSPTGVVARLVPAS